MASTDATSGLAALVGRNLRIARKSRGLTQHQLAVALGCEDMAISRWERGQNRPSDINLVAIAEVFSREVAWFFTKHDEPDDDDRVAA